MLHFINDENVSIASIDETNGTNLRVLQDLYENNRTNFDSPNLITRPYPRAIMQETNISSATVSPTTFGETGHITFGGRGYSLANIPVVEVRRPVSGKIIIILMRMPRRKSMGLILFLPLPRKNFWVQHGRPTGETPLSQI